MIKFRNVSLKYDCDLNHLDLTNYKKNPIVLFNHDMLKGIAKAKISDDNKTVTVYFMDKSDLPNFEHTLSPATVSTNYKKPELLYLSIVPVLSDQ